MERATSSGPEGTPLQCPSGRPPGRRAHLATTLASLLALSACSLGHTDKDASAGEGAGGEPDGGDSGGDSSGSDDTGGTGGTDDTGTGSGGDDDTGAETPDPSSWSALAMYLGTEVQQRAGERVGRAGDLDGDGLEEVLLMSMGDGGDGTGLAPRVHLMSGIDSGSARTDEAQATLLGFATGLQTGAALDAPGDLDGDGYDDLVVGAPTDLDDPGYLFVVSGPVSGSVDLLESARVLTRLGGGRYGVGEGANGGGDFDGDGLPDLAVACPTGTYARGAVHLLTAMPAEGAPTDLEDQGAAVWVGRGIEYPGVGEDLDLRGDFDGDGLADLVIGAPHYFDSGDPDPERHFSGMAFVVPGSATPESGVLDDLDIRLLGAASSWLVGEQVESMGDLDGDGLDELAISAPQATAEVHREGIVYLVAGGTMTGLQPLEELAYAQVFGHGERAVAGRRLRSGDVDGDGTSDLIFGVEAVVAAETDDGLVVVSGTVTGTVQIEGPLATPPEGLQSFGSDFEPVGDVDGDGREDLWVGARRADELAEQAGAAYLLPGAWF